MTTYQLTIDNTLTSKYSQLIYRSCPEYGAIICIDLPTDQQLIVEISPDYIDSPVVKIRLSEPSKKLS